MMSHLRHAEPLRFHDEAGKSKSLQFGSIRVRGASLLSLFVDLYEVPW
jgi:hypothetical protein